MAISYNRLWKLLVDKKMRKDEPVSLENLIRICEFLRCDISDVMELVPKEAAL